MLIKPKWEALRTGTHLAELGTVRLEINLWGQVFLYAPDAKGGLSLRGYIANAGPFTEAKEKAVELIFAELSFAELIELSRYAQVE